MLLPSQLVVEDDYVNSEFGARREVFTAGWNPSDIVACL